LLLESSIYNTIYRRENLILIFIYFILKLIIFNIIIRIFVKDLTNINIRLKITRTIIAIDRLLKIIYNIIEKTRYTKIKIKKL